MLLVENLKLLCSGPVQDRDVEFTLERHKIQVPTKAQAKTPIESSEHDNNNSLKVAGGGNGVNKLNSPNK